MSVELKDICAYIDYLIEKEKFFVSLHGSFAEKPQFSKYNFHFSPYCIYIKSSCNCQNECATRQKAVLEKCKEGEFCGACYAGAFEFVYPVCANGNIVGFVSVGGYQGLGSAAKSKALHFAEKHGINKGDVLEKREKLLSKSTPNKAEIDAVLRPLCFMLKDYLENNDEILCDGTLYNALFKYISLNHCSKLTMQDLALELNYSVSSLSHMFKKHSGMSISEYIEKLRLDEAEQLLKRSEYSVSEISDLLGFCNSAYFSSVFKNRFGVSPREFKKQNGI